MPEIMKGSLEENVLCALVFDDECAARIVLTVTHEMFDSAGMKLLARRALEYVERYGKTPKKHFRDLFESELRRSDASGTLYRSIFAAMDELSTHIQPEYVLDKLEEFVETSAVRSVLVKAQEALENNDLEGAKLAMASKEMQVSYTTGTWLHDAEAMLRFLNKTEDEHYSSGVTELDNRGLRPSRKTIMVMIAPPKAGKSWYLINQGKTNLARRKSVLHITCENSEELTAKRYIMAMFAMSTHELSNLRLPQFNRLAGGGINLDFQQLLNDPKVLDETQRTMLTSKLTALSTRAHLLIKEFPSGALTVPQISAYLDLLHRVHAFIPDMLIVDYPKMMRIDPKNYRLDLGRILIDLRGLAVTRNIAVTTVMQGSKKSKSAKVVSSAMIGEDYSVVGTADTIITYSQTPEEKKIGLARILADSARDTDDSYLVMVSQSYATGQFCLDSVFMTQHLESEAEKFMGGPSAKVEEEDDE